MSKVEKIYSLYRSFKYAVPEPNVIRPLAIQFPVNDICNSGCQMCDIWKNKKSAVISPEEAKNLFSDPLFKDVRGLGINGGEPTLRKDLAQLVESSIVSLPSLKVISLITNGFVPKKVKLRIDELASVCAKHGVSLDVMVSLDGFGSVHDEVRGRLGNWDKALDVIEYARGHDGVRDLKIGCTIIKTNVLQVERLLYWAMEKQVYARFRVGVPHQRLYSNDERDIFALSHDERFHLICFIDSLIGDYEKDEVRRAFLVSLKGQIAYGKARASGCQWAYAGATISSTGEMAYCAVESPDLGSAVDNNPSSLYWDNLDELTKIRNNKCDTCLHDYYGVADRKILAKALLRRWLDRHERVAGFARTLSVMRTTRVDKKRIAGIEAACSNGRFAKTLEYVAPSAPKARVSCLLIGWYGTETLGDKAILGGVTRILAEAGVVANGESLGVVSLEPYLTEYTKKQLGLPQIGPVLSVQSALELIERGGIDKVIFAGGPVMTGVRPIIDMYEIAARAKSQQAKFFMIGVGFGPINRRLKTHLKAINGMVRMADLIITRDAESARWVEKHHAAVNVVPNIDPAFYFLDYLNKSVQTAQYNREEFSEDKRPRLLIALRKMPIGQYSVVDQGWRSEELEEFMAELVRRLDESYHVIPFCMHKYTVGGDDRLYYRQLFEKAGTSHLMGRVDTQHRTVADDYQLFKDVDAVFSMRFHSVVFALSAGHLPVALDYTGGGKVKSLMKKINEDESCFSISARLRVDEILRALHRRIEDGERNNSLGDSRISVRGAFAQASEVIRAAAE